MLLLYIISMTAICEFFRIFSVKEIQSYLDPATADEMTLSDAAKAEIILAGMYEGLPSKSWTFVIK